MRYFIVFYSISRTDIHCDSTYTGDSYPTKAALVSHIAKKHFWNEKFVLISNIIELSKTDFESWNS